MNNAVLIALILIFIPTGFMLGWVFRELQEKKEVKQ